MKRLRLLGLGLLILVSSGPSVFAAQSNSATYQVNEVQFGPGGVLEANSPNYRSQQNLGSTAGGRATSPSYWADAGYLTPNAPFLEMSVTAATVNLGNLTNTTTATGIGNFSMRAYVNSGYTVISVNDPPKNESGFALTNLTSPTASNVGTEQFGINLVQNLTTCPTPAPANYGASPVLMPDSTFANGVAATGYNTCGQYKYVKGDVIAQNNGNGWGQTNYTISYMININSVSKAGKYSMVQDLVAVATY